MRLTLVVAVAATVLSACGPSMSPDIPQRAAAPLTSPDCDPPPGARVTEVDVAIGYPMSVTDLVLASDWILVADVVELRPSQIATPGSGGADLAEIVLGGVSEVFESGLAGDADVPASFLAGTGLRAEEGDVTMVRNLLSPDVKAGDRGLFFLQQREWAPYGKATTMPTAANGVFVFQGDAYRCSMESDRVDRVRQEVESYAPSDVAARLAARISTFRDQGAVSEPLPRCTDAERCHSFKRYFEDGRFHEVELTPDEYRRYGLRPVG